METNWFEIYDKESSDKTFEAVNYMNYSEPISENEKIISNSSSPLEGIIQDSLVRIWRIIYSSYCQDAEREMPTLIAAYIESELKYAKDVWILENLGKRLISNLKRLRGFTIWLNKNEKDKKHIIRQYIERSLSLVLKHSFKYHDSWTLKLKQILKEVIHLCEEKKSSQDRFEKRSGTTPSLLNLEGRGNESEANLKRTITALEESASPVYIEIPSFNKKPPRPKITQNGTQRSETSISSMMTEMNKQSTPKAGIEQMLKSHSRHNSNVLHSIYKDSPRYNQYTKFFPEETSNQSSILGVNVRKEPTALENLGILDELMSGKWIDEAPEKKSIKRAVDKLKTVNFALRTMRSMTRDMTNREVNNETIQEESGRNRSDTITNQEKIPEEIASNLSEQNVIAEEDEKEDDIVSELKNIVNLSEHTEINRTRLRMNYNKNKAISNVLGRQRH
ncbi:unnamed protein product [Blepharisma stoltei]|uniref:Uncharacterized protein n=1 Tax=Blepharisma stoltei TaxID=1481888 RepID=A0AAU9K158_9CILI|nr:unnamed protein product [Blepharisma stoltei]